MTVNAPNLTSYEVALSQMVVKLRDAFQDIVNENAYITALGDRRS